MNRSRDRILTTHVGSLPNATTKLTPDEAVAEVVEWQRQSGFDIINTGVQMGLNAWAKLKSLVEGANLASQSLW